MQRLKAAILSAVLLFLPISSSFAADKPGAVCPKLKASSSYIGIKLVCVKSGKRLIWQKVLTTKKAVPTPTPTPKSAQPVPATEPTQPSAAPVEDVYQITKLKAYKYIRSAADKGDSSRIKSIYHVGPAFPADLKDLYMNQSVFVGKLCGTFFNKEEIVNIYLYTEKDSDLIRSDLNLNFNFLSFDHWFKQWNLGQGREHNIGIASYYLMRNNPPQGHAGLAVYSGSNKSSIRKYGIQVMPHEYWHIVQDYFIQGARESRFSSDDAFDLISPPSFREGSANTVSFAMASDNFEDYLKLYQVFVDERKYDSSMKIFKTLTTKDKVVDALEAIEVRSKNPEAHEASYLLGQLLYEWVIAEYGFDGYRKLIINQLVGNSFEDNLKVSLGITKEELYKGAAGHILSALDR